MKKTQLTRLFCFMTLLMFLVFPGISYSNVSDSACELYDLVVEKGECTSDSTYTLTFDFQYVNVGGDGFDLWANGQPFGYYLYSQLPVTITNFPKSGNNNDWIKVCDNDNENCCRIAEFPTKECEAQNDCSIFEVEIEKGDCTSDSTYEITINFLFLNVQSDMFDLWANGSFYGSFQYAELPITIVDFPKSGNNNDWIKICDNDNPNCCKIHEFPSKECENNEECDIIELVVEAGECNEDGFFFVTIDFMVINPAGDGFKVQGNGMNHGEFLYSDLPITIGPLDGDCEKEWEFVVRDLENLECAAEFVLGEICCEESECEINDLNVDIGDCNEDGTYKLWINFQYNAGQSDSFKVFANGAYFGIYPYNLPLLLPNFPKSGGNHDWVEVCDSAYPDCCDVKEFESPECENNNACMIKELELQYECEGDSVFFVELNFVAINPGPNGFRVKGNGIVYGEYNYADVPIVIGPLEADCMTEYEFLVQDKEFLDCQKGIGLGEVCCGEEEECQILELEVTVGPCTSDSTYLISIDFQYQQPGNDYFDLWLNGEYHGYHPLSQLPFVVSDFVPSGNPKDEVKVCINDAPNCCAEEDFFPPNCLIYGPAQAFGKYPKNKEDESDVQHSRDGDSIFEKYVTVKVNSSFVTLVPSGNWTNIQQINVLDVTGKVHTSISANTAMAYDSGPIILPEINFTGVYFIQIRTDIGMETFKLFIAK